MYHDQAFMIYHVFYHRVTQQLTGFLHGLDIIQSNNIYNSSEYHVNYSLKLHYITQNGSVYKNSALQQVSNPDFLALQNFQTLLKELVDSTVKKSKKNAN